MIEKYPGERAVFYIDCSAMLGSGESITGTPTFTSFPTIGSGPAALVFESASVNVTHLQLPSGNIGPGKVLTVIISGGQPANDRERRVYSVVATFNTNTGNTLVSKSLLAVLPLGPG